MRFLSLFSGIGGLDLGLEREGWKPVAFCENDEYCRGVLARHWPGVPCHDDVRTLELLEDTHMAGKLKKLNPEDVLQAIELYQSGLSLADVGAFFGVTRQSMHDLLKRRIKLRPRERRGKDNHFYRGGPSSDPRVHDITEKAIARGVLVPKPCEVCGANGTMSDGRREVQAHHDDYNKPLEVRWLCQRHHHEWHQHNTPIKRREVQELARPDAVVGGFP